jgi:L-lactate utilization protein LutB
MDDHHIWHNQLKVERAAKALKKHDFQVVTVATKDEARAAALELIAPTAKVGVAGTVTIREIGLMEALEARGNKVVHHWHPNLTPEAGDVLRKEELLADVLLTSSNAITETGELINIDGTGNRVAAMIYGPGKMIIIAGANKIAPDITSGLSRARNVASAMNAHRLNSPTPCAKTGVCSDCDSPGRICRVTTILERRPNHADMTIILMAEESGF